MSADPLSDVLRAVNLSGAVFFDVAASEPWVAAAPAAARIAGHVAPGAQHVIEFHVVLAGECWASVAGEEPRRLATGDAIVFPQGDAHVLASAPLAAGPLDLEFYASLRTANLPIALRVGQGASTSCELACGFLACDLRPFNPLIASLPRVLHDRAGLDGPAHLRPFLLRALAESRGGAVGSQCVLTRLAELLFVEVLRRHLDTLGPEQPGWLGALRDPLVGRALAHLHERPARAWTLEELAAVAATSRSVLAERFRARTGLAPMQYLTQWRMQLACRHLEDDARTLGAIAAEVGYESESAFQRTFKKVVGVTPGAWRRARRS